MVSLFKLFDEVVDVDDDGEDEEEEFVLLLLFELFVFVVEVACWQAAAWQAAAAAATAVIEFNNDDVEDDVDMIEDEVEPVSLVVSAPTRERTEARRARHVKSGIWTGIESGFMKCCPGGSPNSSLIAYNSACKSAFSLVNSKTLVSNKRSEIRLFSLDLLAASLFFLLLSQYVSSFLESGINSRCFLVHRTLLFGA